MTRRLAAIIGTAALCALAAIAAAAAPETSPSATAPPPGATPPATPGHAPAAAKGEVVERVDIVGNVRVEEDAIRVHLETQPGQPFDQDTLDRDIRSVYGMGFFDQVNAETAPAGKGVAVTLRVVERPLVRTVAIDGNDKLEKEELEGALKIRPHVILDPAKVREGIDAAKKLYADKGYLDAKITYTTAPAGENEVDLKYQVDEGEPIRVQEIHFEGNKAFSDRTLKGIMQTSTAWILTPITGAGNLNKDVLRTDAERITAWYYDHGYVTVRVDEPQVTREEDGLVVRIKIDEGPQFDVGTVTFAGNNLPPDQAGLREGLKTTPGDSFSASDLRDDVQKLTEKLSDDGYAFATVDPDTDIDADKKVVNIIFRVDRGKPVIVDRIDVQGNTKTRDYVVRREMRIQEQELFSGSRLRKSREALQRLGFFQEVNVTTRKSPVADDRMNVVVDVKEGQTGAFSAGAGFSSADSLLFNVRVQENNLFGRGQRLVVNADVGSIRRNIILSFTEPYLFGTPLTAGFDAFSWRLLFEDFARSGTGASFNVNYPVTAFGWDTLWGVPLEDVRVGAAYRIEQAKISNLGIYAPTSIRLEEGSSLISSITPSLSRNTLNHAFDPTAGSIQEFSTEIAGLGGERFVKVEARNRFYYTFLHWKPVGDFTYSLGLTGAYGLGDRGTTGDELPLFERYFPGGINSIRGFKTRTLGPREEVKNSRGTVISTSPIGGSTEVIVNNEVIFPLVPSIGLKGVAFVDAGNAYQTASDITWNNSVAAGGLGARWLSPLGPLRVELGYPIKEQPRSQKSLLLFSFGGPFQF